MRQRDNVGTNHPRKKHVGIRKHILQTGQLTSVTPECRPLLLDGYPQASGNASNEITSFLSNSLGKKQTIIPKKQKADYWLPGAGGKDGMGSDQLIDTELLEGEKYALELGGGSGCNIS